MRSLPRTCSRSARPLSNRSRAGAGYPLAPPARELCRRVGLSWPEVKLNAADPGRDLPRVLGNVAGEDQERGRRPEDLVSALRSVALRLQIVPAADDDDEGSVAVAAVGTAKRSAGIRVARRRRRRSSCRCAAAAGAAGDEHRCLRR